MSEGTTTGSGSTRPAREAEHRERTAEIAGERGEATLAATNGPPPDHDEQLVVVRRAIYDARTQANHWRQVTGVDNAPAIASQRDRDADVLEHVLRHLIAPTHTEDVSLLVLGERRNFRLEVDGRQGRVIIRFLDASPDVGDNRVLDIDMLTATHRLLREFGHVE